MWDGAGTHARSSSFFRSAMRFSKSWRSCSACFRFCFATSIFESKSPGASPGSELLVDMVPPAAGAAKRRARR